MNELHSGFLEYLVVSLDEIGAGATDSFLLSRIFDLVEEKVILLLEFHRALEALVKLLDLNTLKLLHGFVDFLVDFLGVYLFALDALFF